MMIRLPFDPADVVEVGVKLPLGRLNGMLPRVPAVPAVMMFTLAGTVSDITGLAKARKLVTELVGVTRTVYVPRRVVPL